MTANEKDHLLFAYIFSGCCNISAIFGVRKVKFLKMVAGKLPTNILQIFKNAHSVTDDIKAAGVEVFKFILTKGKKKDLSLNDLRLQKFNIICGKGKLHPERLPPTQGAAEMHAIRVYWQFQEWANLSHLDPSQYGWKKVNNTTQ